MYVYIFVYILATLGFSIIAVELNGSSSNEAQSMWI